MATRGTNTAITQTFQTQVARLHKDWESVQTAYENFAERQLRFAEKIKELWTQAKAIDKEQSGNSHQNYIRQTLQEIIKTDNASILSRWVTIGTQAPKLLPLASSLPSQRDALYEAAKAVEKREGSVSKWVERGQISPESTVREVKALFSGAKSQPKPRQSGKKRNTSLVSVELRFKRNYGDTATLLKDLITSSDIVEIKAQPAFVESLKELLGKDGYEKIAKKFA